MSVSIPEETIQEIARLALEKLTAQPEQTADVSAELNQVSTQLQAAYKAPQRDRVKIAKLEKRSDELWQIHGQAQQAQAQQAQAGRLSQRQAIEAKLQPLIDEYGPLSKMPTRNRARLAELTAQMQPLWQQLDGLK